MPDSSIVSDTSPLLYLGRIGQLEVLPLNTLGPGERATIAYARAHGHMLVALDDRRARMLARQLALPIVGLAGLLIRAKKVGILPAVKPYLEAAQSRGFYLHPDTYAQALLLVGER